MRRQFIFFVILILCFGSFLPSGFAKYTMGRGQVLRYYEERSGEWKSYLLVKDMLGKEEKYFVHPIGTLVKRGPQIESFESLIGGVRVSILYKTKGGRRRASVIKIENPAR